MELTPKAGIGEFRERIQWMSLVAIFGLAVLILRLFYVQVIEADRWTEIAENNVLRRMDLPTTRGLIRDVRGRVIATNRPSYTVYVIPGFFRMENFPRLAEYLALNRDERDRLEARIRGAEGPRRFHALLARADIEREALALVETHRATLPGVRVSAIPVRHYPFGELAAHAIGFLNEVNADDLREHEGRDYRAGERIGRSGIEQAWESILRGRRGWERVEHDVRGMVGSAREALGGAPEGRRQEPVPGRDLVLSLDMELMRAVDRVFRGRPSGAAAVVEVNTGRVLALYSKPSIDPNLLISGMPQTLAREIDENPYHPRIDKSIYGSYFPGSTFKPFTALAGLEAGVVDARTMVSCTGRHTLGRRVFRCQHVHGPTMLHRALVESCNVYFYNLAEAVTMDRIAQMAFEFGLGRRTGIGINQETPGLIPTRAWYAQNYPGQWRIGHTLNTAIGQGNTHVTVLQLALAYAALANGGTLYVPRIVERVEGPDGDVIERFPPSVRRQVNVRPRFLSMVQAALTDVVANNFGTAHRAQVEEVSVAGKTGTAQVSEIVRRADGSRPMYRARRDHAWFAGYAPADRPEIAIVVLVEHGGSGGHEAAPLVTAIAREWFTRIRPGAAIPSVEAARRREERRR
ncbi:MAG: penicillin-binding protein 2 [Polyangiales bacterium]